MNITKELLERHARGLTTAEEKRAIELWLKQEEEHLPPIENEEKHIAVTWARLSSTMAEDGLHDKNLEGSMAAEIREHFTGRANRLPKLISIAASFLLVSLAGWFFLKEFSKNTSTRYYSTITTKSAERKRIVLPDGTTVDLNAGSELKFQDGFKSGERFVQLTGEAFFSVAKDPLHPFVIVTDSSRTEVLGTRFNLMAYKGEKTVLSVEEGKVRFGGLVTKKEELIVTAGKKAVLHRRKLDFYKEEVVTAAGWKTNVFTMQNESLADVAAHLERWYNVEVTIKSQSLKEVTVTGTYKNASLEKILSGLSYTANLRYKINGRQIEIY